MRSMLTILCLFSSSAHAVPGQFTHQGRLLADDGTPLTGEATITFRVTNEETGGDTLWSETQTVPLTNGFYAAVLGADEAGNPLDTDVLQQFQYRKTGVDLTVEPIVQASGLVDIRIRQSLSETQDTSGGDSFLPTILNRAVETSLTLRDGGSVVLGGLISKTTSQGEQGVPWLGKLPLLGALFRTASDSTSTTELMVMVVPYVVRSDEEARNVSELLKERIRSSSEETWNSQKMFQ